MRSVTKLSVVLLLAVFIAACGSDKKDDGQIGGGLPSNGGSSSAAPAGLNDLSLVYVDSRNSTPQLFVAKSDGTGARKVMDLKQGSRPMDLRNGILIAGGGETLVLIDLRDGRIVEAKPNGNVLDARFIDADTIVFTTAGGCGGPERTRAILQSHSIKDGAKKELYVHNGAAITIAGIGKDGAMAIAPRGCDVAVSEVLLLNAKTGTSPVRTETRGCGFVIASPETMDAVVSWKACTPTSDARKDIDATVYGLGPSARAPRDLRAPAGGANPSTWVLRPGGKEAALATAQVTGTGPGSTLSTGLWLVDLRSGDFKALATAAGAEQFPVSWTQDGRYLLAASVQAQGMCSYSIVDANEKKVTPLPEALTFCGPNGYVLGWTAVNRRS
jgi:hypothetical protein